MMTDVLNSPAPAPSAAPAANDPQSMPELEFLKEHGEDVSDLYANLEQVLRRDDDAPAPAPAPRLEDLPRDRPVLRLDGTLIEQPKEAPAPTSTPAPQAKTPQEQALDPYAPDGSKPAAEVKPEDAPEPGEVLLDAEGRARDAKTGKYVPHAALHQERERRKEIEAELTRRNEEWARAEERLKLVTELAFKQEQTAAEKAKADAAPAPEAEIDPEVDIFGWAKQQRARAEAAERRLAEIAAQNQRQHGEMQTQNRFRADVTNFASKNPDFFEAHRYLTDIRKAELQALGFENENQIAQQILAEEKHLVQLALDKDGGSPAETLYKLAKAKGYKPKEPEPAPAPAQQAAPAQAQQQAAPAQQQPIPNVSDQSKQQIANVQNGLQASASLSGVGGTPAEGLTMQQIADMNEEDFSNLVAKMSLKKFDRLLGGR